VEPSGENTGAEALAAAADAANEEVIAFARSCTEDQWRTTVPGENWPVGVVVHHVAEGHLLLIGWLAALSRGEDVTDSAADVDEANAVHARRCAAVRVDETVALLRANGAKMAAFIRSLDDAALARAASFGPGNGMEMRAEQAAGAAARHCQVHLANARSALGPDGP
jgi:hypothetical protein